MFAAAAFHIEADRALADQMSDLSSAARTAR
jgi:hypothetical protein